jgi:hypothetical protein
VYITPHTVLALWVRFYDLVFLTEKKTISVSAVALAGSCLCYKCYRLPYTLQKTCFEFQNRGGIVGLILDPNSDMMFLTEEPDSGVYERTTNLHPILGLQPGSTDEAYSEGCPTLQ